MSPSRRENELTKLVAYLWDELGRAGANIGALGWTIRQNGMGWALPTRIQHLDDDDWLTPDEIAHELGYSAQTIRVWAHRYGLMQVKGRYRWGDMNDLHRATTRRNQQHG